MTYNGKTVSDFERDALHREISRTQGVLTQHQSYDVKGRKTWQSSINNKIASSLQRPEEGLLWRQYGYSASDELIASNDALRGTYYYDYYAEGRITGVFNQRAGYQEQQMHYDAADNILNQAIGYWDEQQRKVVEPVRDNRLKVYQRLLNRYDAFGNLIERHANGKITYLRYNASNQLIGVRFSQRSQTDEVSYHYDALGRRIKKINRIDSENIKETNFIWHGLRLLQERKGVKQRTWFYSPTDAYHPIACALQTEGYLTSELYYYHNEINGLPLDVTNETGDLVWSRVFDVFGKYIEHTPTYCMYGHSKPITQQFEQLLRL
uniref:RHS domain-containing protein n=1 Tax=Thorsellia kenyensis TaxID=1549888 RepID=UPI0036DEC596